ncbi:hypothetical protein D9M73_220740 [compost metagenome]
MNSRPSGSCWFQISRLSSKPTGTCRLFITARVPPETRQAPLFHQYSPNAVEHSPRKPNTLHCTDVWGKCWVLPNNRNAGKTTSNAPR